MKKIFLIAGLIMAISGSAFANEEADEAKLALVQQCTQSADEAGLEGEDRQAFIDSCSSEKQEKTSSEEG